MKYEVLHEIPGRIRVRCQDVKIDHDTAAAIEELLGTQDGIVSARLSPRTGNLLIHHSRVMPRHHVFSLLNVMEKDDWDGFGEGGRKHAPNLFEMTLGAVLKEGTKLLLKFLFLPATVRYAWTVWDALPTVAKGTKTLLGGRMDVSVLDASALTILAARRDFAAIRSILWMFEAADALEDYTREQSRLDLADALALKVDNVWIRTDRGDVKRPLAEVRKGDLVVIQTGSVIPVDGIVVEGEAMVNQSVLTGESAPAHKERNLTVFAGTVIDEGTLVVRVEKAADDTRLQGIIKFIEESESLKAGVQSHAEQLADAIVPYSLGLALVVLALTRSPIRASAVLMVDYSCAIRMSTPLTILGAIQEGVRNGVLIKGGKYIEALANVDSLVIDKTGTLTQAKPSVARVVALDGWNPTEVLRLAACIEEHFPHPVGRAVVKQADSENLRHREKHAKPEYILAHGIVVMQEGKQVCIGSQHFIFEDQKVAWTDEARAEAEKEAGNGHSLLYMAYDGKLVGILAIEDPIRPDAAETLSGLRENGVAAVHMLTGDGERTARVVAGKLGVDTFQAGLLPVQKADFIKKLRAEGRRVMFTGDGVNDSPALSAADVGVSLKDGADIAREVAGVVLVDGKLADLATAKKLSRMTLDRIHRQFVFIMGLNSVLIGFGLFGMITPRLAALLHNLGTVAVTINSIKRFLPEESRVMELPAAADDAEAEEDGGADAVMETYRERQGTA